MRVRGNVIPKDYELVTYPTDRSKVVVYLRENVEEVEMEDKKAEMYEYDEYQVITKYYDGIQRDVQKNFETWMETGRCLEEKQ